MKRYLACLAALALAFSAPVAAADTCTTLAAAIEHSIKVIALQTVKAGADDSAPRASLYLQQIGNELQMIAIDLSIMRDNRCPMPKEPLSTSQYNGDAAKCHSDSVKWTFPSPPPSCDMSKWGRPAVSINLPN